MGLLKIDLYRPLTFNHFLFSVLTNGFDGYSLTQDVTLRYQSGEDRLSLVSSKFENEFFVDKG
jgi:hypothetical protein